MSIPLEEVAAQALAERRQAIQAYDGILDIEALEALRSRVAEGKERELLEHVILLRRRQAKADFEEQDRWADLFDKSSIPAGAAVPVLFTFLSAEHVLVDPTRFKWLLAAYLFGGVIWLVSRWLCLRYGTRAKGGLAELGKVD
jgi:HEAT repeat protein